MTQVTRYFETENKLKKLEQRSITELQLAQGFQVADIYLNRSYLDSFSSVSIIPVNHSVMDITKLRLIEITKLVFDKEYRNVVISNGKHMNICSKDITEEIIGTVSAGTIVNKGSFIQNPVTGKNDYCEITLSDGTEGAVLWESLGEIKIPTS